jgi:hypothetical protein
LREREEVQEVLRAMIAKLASAATILTPFEAAIAR